MQYIFHENGECEWYFLSPDDAHHFKSGRWIIDPRGQNTIEVVKGEAREVYRIVELTSDVLRITQP
jgi:hypothetical protein